jgi:glycosyltransferase involved in cell wall biosynthesis
MVGAGPLREELTRIVAESPVSSRIRVLGRRHDVGDLLHASDLLMFVSRLGGMEGMPASVIEACLTGIPVAAYDVAGIREILDGGRTGLVVPAGDEDAMLRSLVDLFDDESSRRELARAAQEFSRSRFSITPVAERYVALYEQVLRSEA